MLTEMGNNIDVIVNISIIISATIPLMSLERNEDIIQGNYDDYPTFSMCKLLSY